MKGGWASSVGEDCGVSGAHWLLGVRDPLPCETGCEEADSPRALQAIPPLPPLPPLRHLSYLLYLFLKRSKVSKREGTEGREGREGRDGEGGPRGLAAASLLRGRGEPPASSSHDRAAPAPPTSPRAQGPYAARACCSASRHGARASGARSWPDARAQLAAGAHCLSASGERRAASGER